MSSFTALMALSASKTQEQNNLVQLAIQERQRKEQQMRKQQAVREAKEREMEQKLRLQHFENEKREQERRKKREEEKAARETALQRRKDEQRDALLYGPKKAASAKSSSSSSAGTAGGREKRRFLDDEDDDDSSPGNMLTREELREQRHQAQMKKLYHSTRRLTSSHSYTRPGRRLPGGAVDVQTAASQSPETLAGKSVKDRLAAMPNTLTKLNTVKRDTRTIDEIVADIAKKKDGKVLDGDNAKHFDAWFSTKKKEPIKKVPTNSSPNSGANTPTSSAPTSSAPTKKTSAPSSAAMTAKTSAMKTPIAKMSGHQTTASSKTTSGSRAGSLDKHSSTKAPAGSISGKVSKLSSAAERERERDRDRDRHAYSRPPASASLSHTKKRPRSESRSESPPSKKRALSSEEGLQDDISSTIWSIFGRKRDRYMAMDVFSDDEDMEVDADALEREENFSARIAKKEDMQAFEEERRHEEEKKRRKKEKERFGRAGQ